MGHFLRMIIFTYDACFKHRRHQYRRSATSACLDGLFNYLPVLIIKNRKAVDGRCLKQTGAELLSDNNGSEVTRDGGS